VLQAATDGVPSTGDALPLIGELGRNSWNISEAAKGNRQLAGQLFNGDSRAGWAFRNLNDAEIETLTLLRQKVACDPDNRRIGRCTTQIFEPARVNSTALTDVELRTNPIFKPFLNEGLLDETTGSAQALREHPHLLSFDIPALSFAAGGTKIGKPKVLAEANKVDMSGYTTNDWPSEHRDEEDDPAWFHSDFKDVAYLYTSQFFKDMVFRGGLK